MKIKIPACIDISHYEDVQDFSLISPVPILVITKATEGADIRDVTFLEYMDGMRVAGLRRGAYHFYRNADTVQENVDNFVNYCRTAQVGADDILVLDLEEDGVPAQRIMDWIILVQGQFPNNMIMLYSRKNILDPIQTTQVQSDFFRTIPVWTAGYPLFPDLYSSPPASYIPDQTRWGPVWLWQYSDAGSFTGIVGAVDVNWVSPELAAWLNGSPVGDTQRPFFNGKVVLTDGHRLAPREFYFHEVRFRRTDLERAHVNGLGFQGTGKYFWETRGQPDIVINGGHADYSVSPPRPFAVVVSDGEFEKTNPTEMSIQLDKDHNILGIEWFANSAAWNTVGVSSILLENGQVPISIRGANLFEKIKSIIPLIDDTYVDPRQSLFWNDTEIIIITIDGRNNGTQGLTQLELANFARERGAKFGGNLDGGDSCGTIITTNGAPVYYNNLPDNKPHAVANHVGFFIKESSMPVVPEPDGKTYQYTVAKNIALRSEVEAEPGHVPPSMFSTGIGTVVPGVYQTDRPTFPNEGVTWVHYIGDGGLVGAIPMEWNNVTYVKLFHEVEPPPPAYEPVTVLVEILDPPGVYDPVTVVLPPKV